MDKRITTTYLILKKDYGSQNWWPVTKKGKIHPEYSGGPVDDTQKFEVMIGAILTQNTSWSNVLKAIAQLNKKGVKTPNDVLLIDEKKLAELIRSAGYYNQKAKKLKILADFVKHNSIKKLEKMNTQELRGLLLSVHGVGPETADSIMLYALNKPVFVIDTYTKRIMSRIGVCKADVKYDGLQQIFHDELTSDAKVFNEYHALLVEHAKRYCKTKPECKECPINRLCEYRKNIGGEMNGK